MFRKFNIRHCPNSVCGRPFQINRYDRRLSASLEQGKITCPHCGLLLNGEPGSVFMTHALSLEQEAIFNLGKRSGGPEGGADSV